MDAYYNMTKCASLVHVSDWTSYFKHHSDMGTTHHVHVDELSYDTFVWKFYYTLHSCMDAPHYVHVDVPSDYLFY
jgi:hypothetical protein